MPSSILSPDETLFFCFGPPKSGTTFLQRTLNYHPEVSCPPEHQFDFVRERLLSLFNGYNQALQLIDKRTGSQGTQPVHIKTQSQIYRYTVETIIKNSACGKRIIGANDNDILDNMDMYGTLFELPRMLAIFRNPIDMGISAWHHNLRLAEEEGPRHRELVMKYGGFEGWLRQCAGWFNRSVAAYKSYSERYNNTMLVRYEDLVLDTQRHLYRIFDFLGADSSADIISNIANKTGFTAMKNESPRPGFFRAASTSFGQGEVHENIRRDIARTAVQGLEYLGYDIEQSRLLNYRQR